MKTVCFGVQGASTIFIYNCNLAAPWTLHESDLCLESFVSMVIICPPIT